MIYSVSMSSIRTKFVNVPAAAQIISTESFDEGLVVLRRLLGWHMIDITYASMFATKSGTTRYDGLPLVDVPHFDDLPKPVRAPHVATRWSSLPSAERARNGGRLSTPPALPPAVGRYRYLSEETAIRAQPVCFGLDASEAHRRWSPARKWHVELPSNARFRWYGS